ncbi:MAG: (2Fe-2S)-binding protein [Oscillospiraceae bacterium]|nr:(2Fe-2S)-binding protein [Oscillospiraceae bacterium]
MRIKEHPVLDFECNAGFVAGKKITFFYNDREVEAYEGDTIAAALHDFGVRKLGESPNLHRPRGLFCAIGNCSSCFMVVDGVPNSRVCIMKVKQGMDVKEQVGKGNIL